MRYMNYNTLNHNIHEALTCFMENIYMWNSVKFILSPKYMTYQKLNSFLNYNSLDLFCATWEMCILIRLVMQYRLIYIYIPVLDRFILIIWQISRGETSASIGIFEWGWCSGILQGVNVLRWLQQKILHSKCWLE